MWPGISDPATPAVWLRYSRHSRHHSALKWGNVNSSKLTDTSPQNNGVMGLKEAALVGDNI